MGTVIIGFSSYAPVVAVELDAISLDVRSSSITTSMNLSDAEVLTTATVVTALQLQLSDAAITHVLQGLSYQDVKIIVSFQFGAINTFTPVASAAGPLDIAVSYLGLNDVHLCPHFSPIALQMLRASFARAAI